jgi:hypothetical protein
MTTRVEQRLLEVADTSPETLQAVLEEHGWGDGLPVVPPTEDRVERMLAHASGDPDEQLGILMLGQSITRRLYVLHILGLSISASSISLLLLFSTTIPTSRFALMNWVIRQHE